MEDVLEVHQRPHGPDQPVICLDETTKQLVKETRVPLPTKARPEPPIGSPHSDQGKPHHDDRTLDETLSVLGLGFAVAGAAPVLAQSDGLRRIRAVLYPERRAVIRSPRAFLPLVSHWPWASCQPAEALFSQQAAEM